MTGLLDTEDPLNPSHNFVRRRVRRLVEVDNTVSDVVVEGTLEGRVAGGNRRVVASADK